jgi:hypothetical protein
VQYPIGAGKVMKFGTFYRNHHSLPKFNVIFIYPFTVYCICLNPPNLFAVKITVKMDALSDGWDSGFWAGVDQPPLG